MNQLTSVTINANETEKFKNFSSTWWEMEGPMKILHDLTKIVIPYIQESLVAANITDKQFASSDVPLKNVRILDAGCGGGINAEKLAKLGATVVGLDVNPDVLEMAKNHAGASSENFDNLTYVLEAVEDHAKTNDGKYDAVVSLLVLEHIDEIEIYLKACAKCLKPGGLIFVTTIGQTISGWLLGIVLPEDVYHITKKGSHDYEKFIKISDTERILTQEKCKTEDRRGFLFNTNTFNWFWIEDTSAFYMIQSKKY